MDFSALEVRRFFADRGLTDTDVQDFVRYFFGRHRANAFAAVLDGCLVKEREMRRKREREGHVKAMWRRLRTDMRTRYHAAKHRAKRFSVDQECPEYIYYDTLAKVLAKGLDRIDIAYVKAQQGTVILTPTQWGASKGMPNNGLTWADWIKPEVRPLLEKLALDTLEGKHPKARPPRPFHVSQPDFLRAQRKRLFDMLDLQETNAKDRLALLESQDEANTSATANPIEARSHIRRKLFVHAEIEAMRKAKEALNDWPRLTPLPVDPIHLLGTKMATVEKLVEGIPPPVLAEMDPRDYAQAVTNLINKASAHGTEARQDRMAKAQKGDFV